MDKKDIYEHLAKIYLDASSKRKKKRREVPRFIKNYLFFGIPILTIGVIFLVARSFQDNHLASEIALVIQPETIKINFHFDPAKKEVYAIDLNRMNLDPFKSLGFSVKKSKAQDDLSLRIEFMNAFKEKSEVYLRNIPVQWQDFKIQLAEFKNINDWSNVSQLSFLIEQWNAKEKRDVVYLDNVRLLR